MSTTVSKITAQAGVNIHQFYSLHIRETPEAALADIHEFEGTRGIGEPTRYRIQFTHPSHALSRSQFLNHLGEFVIQPPAADRWSIPEAPRRVQGIITAFSLKDSNVDQSLYEVVLESRLALLRNWPRCRFFLDMSIPAIIEQILREHGFDRLYAAFSFHLKKDYRKRPFVMQWQENDLAFITRLCERSGIWFVCEEGKHCEQVRFCDDFVHYVRAPALQEVACRTPNGLHTSVRESVFELEMRAQTLPTSYTVRTFSTENPRSIPIEATSPIARDGTTYGEAYTWGTPNLSAAEAEQEALLRREAALAAQVQFHGRCDLLDLNAASVLKLANRTFEDARHGVVVVRMRCSASRRKGYVVEFDAIPSDRQYRLPLREDTWPRIQGVITGTIASSGGWKDPYLDEHGRYIVHIHSDRDARIPGLQSCPMRLAKAFAGPDQTGLHMGLVEGTIVAVSFLWGCPDLPFISHVLHTAQHTDPVVAGVPWGTRNTLRTRSNNTLQMEDLEGKEHIKLATEHGKSQLNLGHLVDRSQRERGRGAELRTDGRLALRGGAGVLVSAYARKGASGQQLDMQETIAQLEDALNLAKALASSAQASQAEASDTDAQNSATKASSNLEQPAALVTSPTSAAVVAGKSVQLVSGEHLIGVARGDASWSVWKRFTVAAHDMVSLFTQKGMRLVAAAGAVVVQAQRGRLQLASQDDMTVETVNGALHVKSPREIILNVGGSYLRMTPDGIEMGTRGGVLVKSSHLKKTGPAQLDLGGAAFAPQFVPYVTGCEVWRINPDFVSTSSAADINQLDSIANSGPNRDESAPGPLSDFFSTLSGGNSQENVSQHSPFDGKPSNVDMNVPKIKITLGNPDDQKQVLVPPDPIRLANPSPCEWKISDIKTDVTQHIESVSYLGVLKDRTPWVDPITRIRHRGGGSRNSSFEFCYNDKDKAITCTVRAMLIPMDLFQVDRNGARDTSLPAEEATIPYEYQLHSKMAPGETVGRVKMDYRQSTGASFDLRALTRRIEAVLNQGNYKLLLDGCSKGAACGCRVKVNLKVDIRLSFNGAALKGFNPHVKLKLFPFVLRADTGAWGEKYKWKDERRKIHDYPDANVEAHECGHYFNFPDEYYAQGGWVHESYIENEKINFSLLEDKVGSLTWQGYSAENVMGDGANAPQKENRITASVKPYYLEYIRRQFSIITNKLWRVGYDG